MGEFLHQMWGDQPPPTPTTADPERQGGLDSPDRAELITLDDAMPSHATAATATDLTPASTTFLDGLRCLAALAVFVQHYVGGFDGNAHERGYGQGGAHWHPTSLPVVRLAFSDGSAAVAVFFVLSGYVLSRAPLGRLLPALRRPGLQPDGGDDGDDDGGEAWACPRGLASAAVRRPIRVYAPALGVTLAVAVLMHFPFGLMAEQAWPVPKEGLLSEPGSWAVESARFFNPFRTHGSDQGWFPYSLVVWTILIELKGSMLVYALMGLGYWTIACFIARLILSFLDVYVLGVALISRHMPPPSRIRRFVRYAGLLTGLYLLSQPAHAGEPSFSLDTPGWRWLTELTPVVYNEQRYYRYWHSWGAWLTVYSALRNRRLQRPLDARPLRHLGKVSFMLYLVHLSVLAVARGRVGRMFGNVYVGGDGTWWDNRLWIPDVGPAGMSSRFLASVAVVLPVCLALSGFLTQCLDMPSLRAAKRLTRKLGLDKEHAHHGSQGPLRSDTPRYPGDTYYLPMRER